MFEANLYPELESYEVETDDGYILTLFRVPHISNGDISTNNSEEDGLPDNIQSRPAVLIVHGLVCSGIHWLMNSREKTLPYMLTNNGYDCWLANLRGTGPSKTHKSLAPDSAAYWDFSMDDIGRYDIPAMIDFVLEKTGNSSLYYVGHSMGCSSFFTAMSHRPQYCSKIKKMVALAPAIVGKNNYNLPLQAGILIAKLLGKFRQTYCWPIPPGPTTLFGYVNMFLPSGLIGQDNIANLSGWILKQAGTLLNIFSSEQIEDDRWSTISQQWPASSSLKSMTHFAQVFPSGFKSYDYGKVENYARYGEPEPPLYDMAKVNVPVTLFYSDGDSLCYPQDVIEGTSSLPNITDEFWIQNSKFSHTCFMFGKNADKIVFQPILELFNQSLTNIHEE